MNDARTLWEAKNKSSLEIERFRQWVSEQQGLPLPDYQSLQSWSVENFEQFWQSCAQYCDLHWITEPREIFIKGSDHRMLGHKWFPGARLNYAQNLLSKSNSSKIRSYQEGASKIKEMDHQQLCAQVLDFQSELRRLGVNATDRVAAVTANTDLTLSSMLAVTSLGASWSSSSPDFGTAAIIDRMGQINPKVLFYTTGYCYGGKYFDCMDKLPEILQSIPSVESVVLLDHLPIQADLPQVQIPVKLASEMLSTPSAKLEQIHFEPVSFDHPLFIMFSSGTTGVPKCIIHSTGGTLLQHLKEHMLHCNIGEKSNLLYFTTCGWMMWNWMASSLATGADLTLFEGSVNKPEPDILWRTVEDLKITHFGTSPKFLAYSEKNEMRPGEKFGLESLESILSTGSPLLPEQFDWVYTDVKKDLHLASICGGTDIISCFILGNPALPVARGKIQCSGLGMAVEAWNEQRQSVFSEKGELVCTVPFPSMPTGFWGDSDDKKYRDAYFNHFIEEQVWRHGDFIEFDSDGMIQVYGRSDATLNPGGVRIGTSEIYRVVENLEYVLDSICVGTPVTDDVQIWLFVTLSSTAPEDWDSQIKQLIKKRLSPRHVPHRLESIEDIPYTRSGKKVELAVQKILTGNEVKNVGALKNPESLELYRSFSI